MGARLERCAKLKEHRDGAVQGRPYAGAEVQEF